MSDHSSSLHSINGDLKLNSAQTLGYMIVNAANLFIPRNGIDKNLVISNFFIKDLESYWGKIGKISSPARMLTDLFWISLDWQRIKMELGEINLLDIGCGKGGNIRRLFSFTKGMLDSYVGIDIKEGPRWSELKEEFAFARFYKETGNDLSGFLSDNVNVIISQSVMEHVPSDLDYFKDLADFVNQSSKAVIQFHLIPSEACLLTYLKHGIRQYSPRLISKITSLFGPNSQCSLVKLGGNQCNLLHWKTITYPSLIKKQDGLRKLNPERYNELAMDSIKKDMFKVSRFPAFYALIICSNVKTKNATEYFCQR